MEGAGQASVSPGRHTEAAESQPTTLQVSEITQQASPHGDGAPVSLDDYHLSAELIPLLSAPDATSGIRTFRTRTYVELEDGATVLLGRDAEQNYRARSSTELIASGPRLEQVEGSLLWRRVPQPIEPGSSDSPQTINLHSL